MDLQEGLLQEVVGHGAGPRHFHQIAEQARGDLRVQLSERARIAVLVPRHELPGIGHSTAEGYTTADPSGYRAGKRCIDADMGRTKRSLKSRPKFKQKRRKKDRKMKAKKAAWHKRGHNRNKKRRSKRGSKR